MLEQSEVICIIRPVNQPHGDSRVVVINRASRKFMAYLTGEMKDQLVPAMAHAPREKSRESDTSVTANDTRPRQSRFHHRPGRLDPNHGRLETDGLAISKAEGRRSAYGGMSQTPAACSPARPDFFTQNAP